MIDYTRGASRDRIERDLAVTLMENHTLVVDERRRRPFYFDGRFLTARDLSREQNYFLAREADLGRATGSGVITGLNVIKTGSGTLRITAGHGITISGELVTVTGVIDVNLADVAESDELDARFGLAPIPRPPARNRSGVYIVSLRPVEFTANPITSYPKSLTGTRTVEDGEVIEAVAVTLVPYADESSGAELDRQQARIARDVFLRRASLRPSVNALPLAMISLSRGVLRWVDPFLVRREVGADHGDTLGLGFAPRAIREAQLQQYRQHLQQILLARRQANQSFRFAATDYFYGLPPAGPMPAASVNPDQLTQVYFPPGLQVEISILPEDELRTLVEDALLLPPIDLSLRAQELASSSVLIVAPAPRADFNQIEAGLLDAPAAPGNVRVVPKLLAGRQPAAALAALTSKNLALPIERQRLVIDERWRVALSQVQSRETASGAAAMWYVRRRNLAYRPDIAGGTVRAANDDLKQEELIQKIATAANAKPRYDALKTKAKVTSAGMAVLVDSLAQSRYEQNLYAFGVVLSLYEMTAPLTETAARKVAVLFDDPAFGAGLQKLAATPFGQLANSQALLAPVFRSLPDFDRLLLGLDNGKIAIVSQTLVTAATPQKIAKVVGDWIRGGVIQ